MKKNLLYALAFVFAGLPVYAQQNEEATSILAYLQRAMHFNKAVPQEKVYLHFDNTGYFENETMWFKAYVTRTDNGQPSNLSKVLYVELLNPSGDVIRTNKYPVDSLGQAYGDMKMDSLLGSGFYEVRAYTRYMTNWGVNAVFSRVFPVFKAPAEEGDYTDLSIQTRLYKQRDPNNREHEDSLYQKAIDEGIYSNSLAKNISVQFYPEGGRLVKGKKSRIAVLAVDDNGRPYSSEGVVTNAQNDVLATVQTDTLGRGVFELTPDGNPLTFQMKNLKDKTQSFSLPDVSAEGCILTIDAVSEKMLATLQFSNSLCGKLIGYAVMHNGNITYCDTTVAVPLVEIELDRSKQQEGVSQFTVFDSNGRILAERLFFIIPESSQADSIRLTAITERLKPCGKVELQLQAQPNSSLSFSAIDAASMTNGKQGNMKTWMLLSSEVRGYIHNVDYYFESDDEEHRRAADLLLMTQGWRRYDWNIMAGRDSFHKVQPIEDQFYVFGKLEAYRKRNPVNDVQIDVFLYNQNGESLKGETVTDSLGNYAFSLPFVDGEWNMQIFTRIEDKRKTFRVGIDRQFSPAARYITPLESDILPPMYPNLFAHSASDDLAEEEFIPITKKNHVLQNVIVSAKRYFTNDDWKYKSESWGSQHAAIFYDIDRELNNIRDLGEEDPSIFEFLCRKNALFDNAEYKDLPSPPNDEDTGMWSGRLAYGGRPIKWIVDNGETSVKGNVLNIKRLLGTDVDTIALENDEMFAAITSLGGASGHESFPYWMDEVKSAYIVPSSPKEKEGAVRIYLYTHKKFATESQKGLRRTYFQGFNTPSTFQMEDYSVLPPMADFRRTIYWNPNVKTDASGKAQVEFYNNSTCQGMYISSEGITPQGRVLVSE
ncbi:MAG: hypothetical protein Q4F47_09495 [Bacteroidaceae bacterium]|nr:hypothetical protein [Bacteroidaceae bacterium]